MREVDRCAIEDRGVPGLDLMERAGAQAARVAEQLAPDGPIAVVCGTGNNGGDGFVLARLLRDAGREVAVRIVGDQQRTAGDARVNLERLAGAAPEPLTENLDGVALIVDALLGTGFSGEVRDSAAAAIDAVNDAPARRCWRSTSRVVSTRARERPAPTPSGPPPRSPSTRPRSASGSIPARATRAALRSPTSGSRLRSSCRHPCGLIEPRCAALLPRRGAASTKFSSGHVLLVAGSSAYAGAPRLAGHGAMRAGAGYVTVGVPAAIQPSISLGMAELMGLALAESDGALVEEAADEALARAERAGALAIGPGLGRAVATQRLVKDLVRRSPRPFVLDADGLFAFAGWAADLADRSAPGVLTPHAGELGRLLDCSSDEVDARRLSSVRRAAQATGCVVVLKGDDTLVAAPDGPVAVSTGSAPALATAGTGDVLCGAVGALLAQGVEPFHAACAAVWLHARAGQRAALRAGAAEGVVASDVAEQLPAARREARAG